MKYLLVYRILSSAGKSFTDNFLVELAKREEPNRSGKMTVSVILLFEINYDFNLYLSRFV